MKFLSVVIPALVRTRLRRATPQPRKLAQNCSASPQNEEENIPSSILSSASPSRREVVVADGGSHDGTAATARKLGAKVLQTSPGRGRQLNAGAGQARGEMLLFLHADSILPQQYDELMLQSLKKYEQQHRHAAEWGCFESIDIDGPPLARCILRHAVTLRTHLLRRPYGDQGLFVRHDTFQRLGGFKEWPLLEDLDLVQRLNRACGPPAIVPHPMRTSGRRWARLGLVRTTLINQAILVGYALGVDVSQLAEWYARAGRK